MLLLGSLSVLHFGLPAFASDVPIDWVEEIPSTRTAYVLARDSLGGRLILLADRDSSFYSRPWPPDSSDAWTRNEMQGEAVVASQAAAHHDALANRFLIYNHTGIGEFRMSPSARFRTLPSRGQLGTNGIISGTAAAFDRSRSQFVVFGGLGFRNIFYYLDQLSTVSCSDSAIWRDIPFRSGPPERADAGAVWDPVNDRLVIVGGRKVSLQWNDHWVATIGDSARWQRRAVLGDLPYLTELSTLRLGPAGDRLTTFGTLVPGGGLHRLALANRDSAAWEPGPPPEAGESITSLALSSVLAEEGLGVRLDRSVHQLADQSRPILRLVVPGQVRPEWRDWTALSDGRRELLLLWSASAPDRFWFSEAQPTSRWSYRGAGNASPTTRPDQPILVDQENDRVLTYHGVDREVYVVPLGTLDLWRRLPVAGTPPSSRTGAAWVFDPAKLELHVIGGRPTSPGPGASTARLDDHHVLRLHPTPNWVLLPTASPMPSPRSGAAAVLDSRARALWLLGGQRDSSGLDAEVRDLWHLSLDSEGAGEWRRVSNEGPARGELPMTFDPVRRQLMLGPRTTGSSQTVLVRGEADTAQWRSSNLFAPLFGAQDVGAVTFGSKDGRAMAVSKYSVSLVRTHTERTAHDDPTVQVSAIEPELNGFPGDSIQLRLEVVAHSQPGRPAVVLLGSSEGVSAAARRVLYDHGGRADTITTVIRLQPGASPATVMIPVAAHLAGAWSVLDSIGVPITIRRWLDSGHTARSGRTSVELVWHTSDSAVREVTVSRRRQDEVPFREVGRIVPDHAGDLVWAEEGLLPGTRYHYRLLAQPGAVPLVSEEAVVITAGRLELSLGELDQEPMRRPWGVSLTLPTSGRTSIELIDLAGRMRWRRSLDGLPPGDHRIAIDAAGLRPGVHWVRLRHEGRMLTRRVTLLP